LSKNKLPTPSEQAIETANVTGFLLFLGALSVLIGVVGAVISALAIRGAYVLAAQTIAKYAARYGRERSRAIKRAYSTPSQVRNGEPMSKFHLGSQKVVNLDNNMIMLGNKKAGFLMI
jgi:hypothetical protein